MSFEDEIRASMQAHKHEAPTADELPELPVARRYRRWLPIAAAAAVVGVVVGVAVAVAENTSRPDSAASTRAPTSAPAPLTCPAQYGKDADTPWVPTKPAGVNGSHRLVPPTTPTSVVICGWTNSTNGNHFYSRLHRTTRTLAGSLAPVAELLTNALPRANPYPCTANLAVTDDEKFLIGLTYGTATVWVSAPGNHCAGATNGVFSTSSNLNRYARLALQSGHWPLDPTGKPPAEDSCRAIGVGRFGQQSTMVPGDPTSLVICADDTTRGTVRKSGVTELVDALNRAAPTRPSTHECQPQNGAQPHDYRLRFRYPSGPDATVTVSPACRPGIDNNALQVDDARAVVAVIQGLLRSR